MDFRLTPEQEAAKKEYDAFFDEVIKDKPEGWLGTMEDMFASEEGRAFHRRIAKELGKKGWLTLRWPKEYGGRGVSNIDQLIFLESVAEHGAPGYDLQGIGMLAPTLMMHGSDEVKKEFLPPIAKGEVSVAQGWSEPNAGSDLASLTTKATLDGDEFVINGQKTWASGAHLCEIMYLPVRTDPNLPKHKGLSYLVLKLNEVKGITMRPLYNLAGDHFWNEVYFDDARIPRRWLVGDLNNGWHVTMSGMAHERSGMGGFVLECRRELTKFVQFCKETKWEGELLINKPDIRNKLARCAMEIQVARSLSYRIALLTDKGEIAMEEASTAKIYNSEMATRFNDLMINILGLYATVAPGSKWAPFGGRYEALAQTAASWEIAGGANEVQKNVVARWGLGFPRL
ncbi:MAG: acyl-CoA dehydrogenase family protein [Chloroflexota bacterium]|nr:acyl-CoA dehydrogenase family protein [Chloroflexota bacterium]